MKLAGVGAVFESQPRRAERRIRVVAIFFLFNVLFAAECQQLARQSGCALAGLSYLVQKCSFRIIDVGHAQQKIAVADDRRQHIVEIVCDASGKSSASIISVVPSTTARSIAFSSSRTLPGQSYDVRQVRASGEKPFNFRLQRAPYLSAK